MSTSRPLHFQVLTLIVIIVIIAVCAWIQHYLAVEYATLEALDIQQKIEGFVPIGRFGDSWPASIEEIREADEQIKFTRRDGQPHVYQGFEGYRLRVVRLESRSGSEVIVVYRSEPIDAIQVQERNDKPIIRKI